MGRFSNLTGQKSQAIEKQQVFAVPVRFKMNQKLRRRMGSNKSVLSITIDCSGTRERKKIFPRRWWLLVISVKIRLNSMTITDDNNFRHR